MVTITIVTTWLPLRPEGLVELELPVVVPSEVVAEEEVDVVVVVVVLR